MIAGVSRKTARPAGDIMVNSFLALLKTYEIVIIVIAAAAFLGVIAAALVFRYARRRTVDETVLESRDEVNDNANAVKVLQALAEGKPDMLEKLASLYDSLLYLTPSAEDEVAVVDEKIKNALGDVKIELSKTRGKADSGKAEKYLADIKLLLAEREIYTRR